MKFTDVLGSGGTVMARTPSRGAMAGVSWAVPPCWWVAAAASWPAWAFAWTAAAASAWDAGAGRRALRAQPTVETRATASRTTTSQGGRCLGMGDMEPRWGARADREGNPRAPPRIPISRPGLD